MTAESSAVVSFEKLTISTEADVEQKIIIPLLNDPLWLGIEVNSIKAKTYLPPEAIDKGAGKKTGYFPDFSVWLDGLPILIIEAKSPEITAEEGYREAQLYAHILNSRYRSGINPAHHVLATNGKKLIYGTWDNKNPTIIDIVDLRVGTHGAEMLRQGLHYDQLKLFAHKIAQNLRSKRYVRPIDTRGGEAQLIRQIGPNSFAPDLIPLIRSYFDSEAPEKIDEILEKGYVNTEETTTYTRLFETLLRERLPSAVGIQSKILTPRKRSEENLTAEIKDYSSNLPPHGRLQLIIGPVGSGKSLFIRRYRLYLQPSDLRDRLHWSTIDFNSAPDNLGDIETWVCEKFIKGIEQDQVFPDLYEHAVLKSIFAPDLRKVAGAYKHLKETDATGYANRLADDLKSWLTDQRKFALSLCRYLIGEKRIPVIVAFDNVDRRDREQQLRIFQVAEWFKSETRSFCIVTLRDTTYERFKNEPPLDAFANTVKFYISPPRFADVVKKRLELGIEFLSSTSKEVLHYEIVGGPRIAYPATKLGEFLKSLYIDLFRSERKVTWVLEALAGKDVRRALEMFTRIITSRHLDEREITSTILGRGNYHIPEAVIIKALMRTSYRYPADDHGFITNILTSDASWKRPHEFLYIECLEYLLLRRKQMGDIGYEGYFLVKTITSFLERAGFVPEDILSALSLLLKRGLIVADHMRSSGITINDALRIHASGYVHLRLLVGRREYVSGCIPTSFLSDGALADSLGRNWEISSDRFDITHRRKVEASQKFLAYLNAQYATYCETYPGFRDIATGTIKTLGLIDRALNWAPGQGRSTPDPGLFEDLQDTVHKV